MFNAEGMSSGRRREIFLFIVRASASLRDEFWRLKVLRRKGSVSRRAAEIAEREVISFLLRTSAPPRDKNWE